MTKTRTKAILAKATALAVRWSLLHLLTTPAKPEFSAVRKGSTFEKTTKVYD